MNKAFRPGQVWLDTSGKRIQAHGGSMHHENGTFYWYGENKERTTPGSGIWHWGVRCYSSTDLYNWDDLGLIIPPDGRRSDARRCTRRRRWTVPTSSTTPPPGSTSAG